jgi:hypothetical protein
MHILFVTLNSCNEVINEVKEQVSKPTREDVKHVVGLLILNGRLIGSKWY